MVRNNNTKALTSLALMETNLLSNDYLSTFLPFLASLTSKKDYSVIEIGTIVQDFKEEFGIGIPRAPMKSILSRAAAQGLIEIRQDGRYYPVKSEIIKISFASQVKESQLEIDNIINSFQIFVKENYDLEIERNDVVDIFINFLDEYSPNTISGEYYDDNIQITANRYLYLMGEFIQQSVKMNSSIFKIIAKLSMAYLIATALTFDEPVDGRLDELSGITLYLDTPIILRLLGLQTEELERSYKEMFETFKSLLNADFKIFQHTLDEVSGIIEDCSRWIENPSYNPCYANPALLNFVRRNYSKTEVDLYCSSLVEKLEAINVFVDEYDFYGFNDKSQQMNSKVFEQKLIEAYKKNNINYDEIKNAASIQYDVHSIENIVKLWGRKSSRSYSKLGNIFITSNSTLAYVCRKYSKDYWWDDKNHKSPCITDYYLGTMLWLSTPAEKIENVSKLKLLADCSAATTLSREVMEKFAYALEKLKQDKGIKNQDFLLLRRYAYEKKYLQNLTLNEENAFKDDTIDEILANIKLEIQKPLLNTIEEKDNLISNLVSENDKKNAVIDELENEKLAEKKKREGRQHEDEKKATDLAKCIINVVIPWFTAAAIFLVGILQFIPYFNRFGLAIKIVSLIISLTSATILALFKWKKFNMEKKLIKFLYRYYRIKRYNHDL